MRVKLPAIVLTGFTTVKPSGPCEADTYVQFPFIKHVHHSPALGEGAVRELSQVITPTLGECTCWRNNLGRLIHCCHWGQK